MDHKAHMEEQAKLLTSMDMDSIFEKAETAIRITGQEAINSAKADVADAYGVEVSDDVTRHLLVCGFALALVMAQQAAENFLHKGN